jgi:dolichol-phosphate mannosyltransferase
MAEQHQGRDILLIPTYNERDTIGQIIREVRTLYPTLHILVIDDNSPDGTQKIVEQLQKELPYIELMRRKEKNGLGGAYKAALTKIKDDPTVRYIITMDADGSHRPEVIKDFIDAMRTHDVAIGSRYVKGNKHPTQNWELWRECVSRGGNIYSRILTGIPIKDLTSGFMCMKRTLLSRIDLSHIASGGYAYQIECKTKLIRGAHATCIEIPITFCERRAGKSKFSQRIIIEGILTPFRLFWQRFTLYKK